MVVDEVVVRVGDPETSWSLICGEKTPRSNCVHDKVSLDVVVLFNCILNEHSVAHDMESVNVQHSEILATMDCDSPVPALMNRYAINIRLVDRPNHVVVDTVSSNFERLACIK